MAAMKDRTKSGKQSAWSRAYAFLLFFLVLLFFSSGAAMAPTLWMGLIMAAFGLGCVELYLNAVQPDSLAANRWARILARCSQGLFVAGIAVCALEYLLTFL